MTKAMCFGSWFRAGLAAALWAASSAGVSAQDSGKAPAVPFPTAPQSWIGSPPISAEMLKGKAALLWFYEEDCPKCRGKWPGMLSAARKFEGKPIIFIAVNSGNPRGEVESYLRDTNVNWPTIVDQDRSFEKALVAGEVSLQNIYQCRLLLPNGSVIPGDLDDLEKAADRAVKDAKWNVDPTGVPAALKQAWLSIELGRFADAAAVLKKSLASGKADVKAGAELLNAAVQERLKARLEEAKSTDAAGSPWGAYKAYAAVAAEFKGYDLPTEVADRQKALAADPAVKAEGLALKQLDSIKKLLQNPALNTRKRGLGQLEKLAADQPDTDAGKEAKTILAEVGK